MNTSLFTPAPQPTYARPRLLLARYQSQELPLGYVASFVEVPAHLDISSTLKIKGPFTAHTEYSSKARKYDSPMLEGLNVLRMSHRNGVPELWVSTAWSEEYAKFIERMMDGSDQPTNIEIHPPYCGTVASVDAFLDIYSVFEQAILAKFPNCRIVLENRSGTKHPRPFLVSGTDSILAFGQALIKRDLRLGLALDVAQMFTAEYGSKHLVGMEGAELLSKLIPIKEQIHSLHLWGRGATGGAHAGNLDGLFDVTTDAKRTCLEILHKMLSDGPARDLVLEVRNADDVAAILNDLQQVGFSFDPRL